MSKFCSRALRRQRIAGFATALALPFAGVALAGAGEQSVEAAELGASADFDRAFSDQAAQGFAENVSPADILEQATPANPEREIADIAGAPQDLGIGVASYYGARFAGRPTASGELFDPTNLTAAHRSLPFGSKVRVTNERTGQSVIVRINDRGPFHGGRVIDLSRAAASEIGLVRQGRGRVKLALLAN